MNFTDSMQSQDLYPTFLKNQVEMNPSQTTIVSVVGQIGALMGGTTIGYISAFSGRRLVMLVCCFIGGCILPAYIIPRDMSLVGSAFFMQFFVGGVWSVPLEAPWRHEQVKANNAYRGPIPIHLSELSPPALKTTVVGFTYQLGNLASSASATIQGIIGERFPIAERCVAGVCTPRFDYGRVIGIFIGAVYAWMIVFLFIGPEMTEHERREYAVTTDDLEDLRKQGKSLQEIGKERARAAFEGERRLSAVAKGSMSDLEKPPVGQHIEATTGVHI